LLKRKEHGSNTIHADTAIIETSSNDKVVSTTKENQVFYYMQSKISHFESRRVNYLIFKFKQAVIIKICYEHAHFRKRINLERILMLLNEAIET